MDVNSQCQWYGSGEKKNAYEQKDPQAARYRGMENKNACGAKLYGLRTERNVNGAKASVNIVAIDAIWMRLENRLIKSSICDCVIKKWLNITTRSYYLCDIFHTQVLTTNAHTATPW